MPDPSSQGCIHGVPNGKELVCLTIRAISHPLNGDPDETMTMANYILLSRIPNKVTPLFVRYANTVGHSLKTCFVSWFIVVGIIFSPSATSLALSVGVIYPDVRQPYQQIFENILAGVDLALGRSSKYYRIKGNPDTLELQRWIRKQDIDTVLALGNGGLRAAEILKAEVNIVVGAVQEAPTSAGLQGIIMTPDPGALFERLKALAPHITGVVVIYNPVRREWLIKLAQRAAQRHHLKLRSMVAEGVQESALLYRELLSNSNDSSEAIWLLHDSSILDERAIMPYILQAAWQKNKIVFSSNPAHVQRGVLFSLFPDNVGMGHSLALMAKSLRNKSTRKKPILVPLQDLFIAVNLRTADHLGLKFSAKQRRGFKLVFPSR
jgi:putative ABC transport system substrate-binding protein